jgi:streptogramin lyase
MRRIVVFCGFAYVLAACSAGGPPPAFSSGPAGTAARSTVTFRVNVPKKRPSVRVHTKDHRGPAYVSAYTQAMTLSIHGPTTVSLTIGLTAQSAGCTATATGFECTESTHLVPCANAATRCYTASVSTYDAYDAANNTIPAGANQLSTDQNAAFTVVVAQANSIGFTLSGVPAQLLVAPANDATVMGPGTITLAGSGAHRFTAQALDADQETITGPGSPTFSLTISGPLAVTATQPSGQSRSFTLTPPTTYSAFNAALLTIDASFGAGSTNACAATGAVCQAHALVYAKALIANFPLAPAATGQGIAWGADGNMWFTETRGAIGKISTYGIVTEYSAGISPGASPSGIAAGPDGRLWFAETGTGKIGKITTGGTVTEYSTGLTGDPVSITLGPDNNLWFTEPNVNVLGNITTGGTINEFPLLIAKAGLAGITSGPDGNLWFTESSLDQIGKMPISGIGETDYPTPSSDTPTGITEGPDHNLWYTGTTPATIGKITTAGAISEYTAEFETNDTTGSSPNTIVTGPDHNLWFTEQDGANIGKATTSGVISEFTGMTGTGGVGIAAGPDGNLWFTQCWPGGIPAIGRLTP